MKKLISIILTFILTMLVLNVPQVSQAEEKSSIDVIIKGKHLNMDVDPILRENRTYIPIRHFAEALDFKVEWIESQRTAKLTNSKTTILIPVGMEEVYLNGTKLILDEKSFIDEERTFIPLRAVAEILSQNVNWDQKNKIAIVGKYTAETDLKDTFIYTNREYNYTLNFPNSWKEEAILETKEGNLNVYDRASYEMFKEQGIENFGPVLKIRAEKSPVFITVPYEDVLLDYIDGIYIETDFGRDFQFFPETIESYKKIYKEAERSLGSFKRLSDKPIYFDEYGFSITFPSSWDGEFEISKDKNALVISSKINEIESLASIHRYTNTEWKNLNYGSDIPVPYDILSQDSDLVFALLYTSDVNYNLENESSVKKYEDMIKDLKNKNFSFEILENKHSMIPADKEKYKNEIESLNNILNNYVPKDIFNNNEILTYKKQLEEDMTFLYLRNVKNEDEVEIKLELEFDNKRNIVSYYHLKSYLFDLKENKLNQSDALKLANKFVHDYGDKKVELIKIPDLYPSLYEEDKHETYGDKDGEYIVVIDLEHGFVEYFNSK